jgi:ribosomal peptide maturation radical SAM protein 1
MNSNGGVTLVCMPFGQVFSPSIGLSLLKAGLASRGISVRVRYFSIPFAELIGQHFYYGLSAESRPSIEHLAGEWIFSRALFGRSAQGEEYIEAILRQQPTSGSTKPASAALIRRILRAREQVDDFLQRCLDDVLRARPILVGFTSMFQQHVASLALARLIKESRPETFIVIGGANCEDVMGEETLRQFSFVDATVSGEGDLVFPEIVRRVLDGTPVCGIPGVLARADVDAVSGRSRRISMMPDLDALPYPDYSDYFEQFEASRFGRNWQPTIYLETSRGCWWGEKSHCTFCGLNGGTMAFRSKSTRRAIDELATLTERHPGCPIAATDNILDMAYFNGFVPAVSALPSRPALFYEVKANLKKEQVRMLRDAGIRSIQPGIESLSDAVLKLMRKGVTAIQNVQLLKWCKEFGVAPGWNLIWGFPGEPAEEYERMASLVPLIAHLPPPKGHGMIRLDRFSPNFYDAARLGLTDVTPVPSYRHVYPLPQDALNNLAYFFTFRYREPRDVASYVRRLHNEVRAWQRQWEEGDLFSVDTGDSLLLWDLRSMSTALLTMLGGADRILYQACDGACDVRSLTECVARSGHGRFSPEAVEQRLKPLVDNGLLIRDGSRYLALAIPLDEYSPPPVTVQRFYESVRSLGKRSAAGWALSPEQAQRTAPRRYRSSRTRSRHRTANGRRNGRRLTRQQFSITDRGEVLIQYVSGPGTTRGGLDAR